MSQVTEDDIALVERIVAAYQRATSMHQRPETDGEWQLFFDLHHRQTHEAFMSGDVEAAGAILRDPGSNFLFYGFDNCFSGMLASCSAPGAMDGYANACLDALVRLANAVGARRVFWPAMVGNDPEYTLTANIEVDEAVSLIEAIEARVCFPLSFPAPFKGEPGVQTGRGMVAYRAPPAIYQAWRAQQIAGGPGDHRVVEIGGGLGRTAYYASIAGLTNYTIVDLPITMASQGYFLGRALGPDRVHLFGEPDAGAAGKVRLVPPEAFIGNDNPCALVLNADGFVELDKGTAGAYWDHIRKVSPHFLSINHEAHRFTVLSLTEKTTPPPRVDRRPYWMWGGYVEELISF